MTADPLAFHNGRFVPPADLTLGFADAGIVFGATVTDFCRTYRRRLFRWPDHLARLRRDCAACHVPLPYTDAELTTAAEHLVAHNAGADDLAVITFATPGPLGYMLGRPDDGPPTVGMHTFPVPAHRYARFFTDGVTLAVAGTMAGGIVPATAKHRSRLHWWLASRRMTDPAAVPVLLDPHGAADTPIGGVLAVADGEILAPPPGSVLESVSVGVVRELCGPLGLPVREAATDYRHLPAGVTELLLVGSGFGVAGVRHFDGRKFVWPGPVCRALAAAWSALTDRETGIVTPGRDGATG